jgi:uncharacterized membrane protein
VASPEPLTLEATSDRLRLLARKGFLSEQGLNRALKIAGYRPDPPAWEWFINYALLLLGTAFALSGIFFFFAYNWSDLPRLAKFGVIEAAIVAAAALAYYQGLHRLVGQVALLAAAMLVGVLLAVYGQSYQTGADAYQLFLTWAGLIFAWVVISAFGPLWFCWLVLLNLSLIFYWDQVVGQDEVVMFELLFLLDAVALLAWEYGASRGLAWLKSRWIPRIIALAVFVALLWPVFAFVDAVQNDEVEGVALVLAPILYIGFIVLAAWLYGAKIKDLLILTMGALSLIVVITYALVQVMDLFDGDALAFLLLGILVIIQAAAAAIGLRWVANSWERSGR